MRSLVRHIHWDTCRANGSPSGEGVSFVHKKRLWGLEQHGNTQRAPPLPLAPPARARTRRPPPRPRAQEACPAPRSVRGGLAIRRRLPGPGGAVAPALNMSLRRALALAACGLAGGSVLFSAVAVGKSPARDAEPDPASGTAPRPPLLPPGAALGLMPLPPAAGPNWCARLEDPPWLGRPAGVGYWDSNWDRREPLALVNLKKKNEETGEEELASLLNHCKPKATRDIFLICHSQYNLDGRADEDRALTPLGREQADLTGHRLASLGLKFEKIIHSSMARATETTEIISKYLPGVKKISTDLLREGAPIEPDPSISHWKPEAVYYEDGARVEAAFRNYIHRADAKQEEDSYEIYVCHANVIRYIVCRSDIGPMYRCTSAFHCSANGYLTRALQFPPEGWLRMSLNNGSITHLVICPNGRVALRTLGDTGFMPPEKITRT
ncbi:serine/threonine-protein phosphatase PGAM5, mitochondrial-like isoform X2 [Alligator mississippiensis]|uniref:serine/threonine-protein phosphatase PGAM5, mitochondrial-like isoform X2 n=1 Tax=Alligator mississippiensis TaxID=8496 RepID=UPI0028775C2B|nr:serine/threonine-protein phosphatase PGAM5, mitochondrial-like isoform X2 [Alligator mississippiensis]